MYGNYLGGRVNSEERNGVHAAGRGDVEDGPLLPGKYRDIRKGKKKERKNLERRATNTSP